MINLDHRFVEISRISEAGFPSEIWPVVFVANCNLRCPYCLNVGIVEPKADTKFVPADEILEQLDSWGEDSVLVSGGEPCEPNSDGSIIEIAKFFIEHNKKVGISTNGTYPDILSELIRNKLVEFVALDCKFSPIVFVPDEISLNVFNASIVAGTSDPVSILGKLQGSLEVLRQWHDRDPEARSEVRTTLYPPIVGKSDVEEIARLVHPKSSFFLQQYRKNINFAGIENPIDPYNDDEVAKLLAVAKENCKAPVSMRWP